MKEGGTEGGREGGREGRRREGRREGREGGREGGRRGGREGGKEEREGREECRRTTKQDNTESDLSCLRKDSFQTCCVFCPRARNVVSVSDITATDHRYQRSKGVPEDIQTASCPNMLPWYLNTHPRDGVQSKSIFPSDKIIICVSL